MKVTIETPEGVVVRTVTNAQLQPGEQSVTWDGRGGNRKPVAGGRYVARVTATNELGSRVADAGADRAPGQALRFRVC